MHFEIVGKITDIEIIAVGGHIHIMPILQKAMAGDAGGN